MFEHVIRKCLEPSYKIRALGDRSDYVYNRDALCTFEHTNVISIENLALMFRTPKNVEYGTTGGGEFGAKRAGELVRWGIDNGVVGEFLRDDVTHFRLLEREPLYVLVGAKTNRRQVRVRRWRSVDEEKQAKKELKREAGRLNRARQKAVAKLRMQVKIYVSSIVILAPELPATGPLERFTVPGVTKLIEIQGMLLENFDDLSEAEAKAIRDHVQRLSIDLCFEESKKASARMREELAAGDDTDLDVLADL